MLFPGLANVRVSGAAACSGGSTPHPPLDDYPLLVWTNGEVRTEDGRASARDIALALGYVPSLNALAIRAGTTPDHAAQALAYAAQAGWLNR
jgi:hypothetical protein